MTAWFIYKRTLGKWWPRVVYDEKPRVPKGEEGTMTSPVLVPADCLGPDGSPYFGRLQDMFPAPREEE